MGEIEINNTLLNKFTEFQLNLTIRNKMIINKYLKKLNKRFRKKLSEIYDLYEINTGAIFLKDEELITLRNKCGNHPIFKIYDCDCLSYNRKYTCNLEDKLILRGPINYYFGLCFLGDLDVSIEDIKNTIENVIEFFQDIDKKLYALDFEEDNVLSLKLILSLYDSIRNCLDINLFFLLSVSQNKEAIYIYKNHKNICEIDSYKLLKEVLSEVYSLLFRNEKIRIYKVCSIISSFLKVQKDFSKYIDENMKSLLNEDLYLYFRKYRESDNIIENLICIDYSVKEIITEYGKEKINKNEVFALGLNYGSIELAIMTEIILDEYGIKVISGNIMKKFRDVMIKPKKATNWVETIKGGESALCILIDENILTGNTVQYATDYLKERGFKDIYKIIIQYPKLSRIKNIVNECKCENVVDRFKNKTFGFNFAAPYSKFCEYREDFIFPYMDKLGTFDLRKHFIYKNLYRNGIYISGSAIDRLSTHFKDFFV
ncbi:MAG: phosphoribosyltransferase [Clostridia bacterium]|nr:phosphoribosyltransferase [Clostridia bacterium]